MKSIAHALLALVPLTGVASGQFWPNVTTTTSLGTFSSYNLPALTNCTGLTAANVNGLHSGTWQQMWMGNTGVTTGWIQFDLGSLQVVTTIAVWNYNSSISTLRGVATMNVSTSLDGNTFTPLSNNLQVPKGTAQPIPALLIPVNLPARYVKFDVLANYGTNYTGLSEVQFVVANSCRGSVTQAGAGCQDSGGAWNCSGYTGCPDLGTTLTLNLFTSTTAAGPFFLVMGVSDTTWNGVPLPINLATFNAPGCSNYIAHALSMGAPAQSNGRSSLPIPIPNSPQLAGGTLFTQYFHLNAAANPFGLVTSDYLKVTVR